MAINPLSRQRPDDPTPQIATAELHVRIPMNKGSLRRLEDDFTACCTTATDPIKGSMPAHHR